MPKTTFIHKLLIAFAFFWITSTNAQSNVDSLKTIFANPKLHDTTRLATLTSIIDNIPNEKDIKPFNDLMGKIAQKNLSNKSLNLTMRKKYTTYLAGYYNNIAIILEESRNDKSLYFLDKSIRLYQLADATDDVYSGIVSKGMLLSRRKKNREAINCYFKALEYFEKNEKENYENLYYVYSNIGIIFGEQEKNEASIKYIKKAIYFIDKKDKNISVIDLVQKSIMYYNIGSTYILLKNYPEATKNLQTALDLAQKSQNNSFVSLAIAKLGLIDLENNKLEAAEKKFTEANSISENDYSKSFTLVYLGKLNYHKKNYKKAKQFLEEGVQIAKKINHDEILEFSYDLLYKIYKADGNYEKAIEMLELYNKEYDSNKIKETRNELEKQQLKYDYDKKALKYKLITERKSAYKNNVMIVLSALLLLLLIAAYFLYRNSKQKQAIAQFEKKSLNQKLLLSQMNPHFIFNSIDNIQSLIYSNQSEQAINYLTKFSNLTRQILENSNENYITLAEELTMIDNYLVIQQLLYNNKFDFKIEVDNKIDAEAILLPPMLTQPFIENAIKHGLRNKADKGFVSIRFYLQESKLFFEVTDNGTGFTANVKPGKNKSLAMKITKERLENITNSKDFEVTIENLTDTNNAVVGAKVLFEIPYIYEN